jgi:hypothetical protein
MFDVLIMLPNLIFDSPGSGEKINTTFNKAFLSGHKKPFMRTE